MEFSILCRDFKLPLCLISILSKTVQDTHGFAFVYKVLYCMTLGRRREDLSETLLGWNFSPKFVRINGGIRDEGETKMMNKILVVDDEVNIADAIAYALRREGHMVEVAYDGKNALSLLNEFSPDLMLLDVMLPEKNGFDVIRSINGKNKVGIILLTAKNDIVDKVLGLELGADDYITKPFDMRELMARVNSLLRRTNISVEKQELEQDIIIKELQVLFSSRKVIVKGQVLELTPKEFDLLFLLLSNIDRVFTRDVLLDKIWGMDYMGGTRTVDIHIQRLRKKLGEDYQDVINTVHGVGYKADKEFYEN